MENFVFYFKYPREDEERDQFFHEYLYRIQKVMVAYL